MAICDAKYKLEPDSNDKDRMGTYYQNMKGKKYIGSDECPEKIYCVFILPSVEKQNQEPWVVDLGHYKAIYAPLNLRGPILRNQENLEKDIRLLLEKIS